MTMDKFKLLLGKFLPYVERIRYLTLHGCGEPLMDRDLSDKVRVAKDMGFQGTGLATNCSLLDEERGGALLAAGLDTLICSIDGATRETHEAIRIGIDFDLAMDNVLNLIRMRNEQGSPTRVVLRFIRQEANADEWPAYQEYWRERLDPSRGDDVLVFDVHNWGNKLGRYGEMDLNRDPTVEELVCEDLWERMIIFSSGDVGLCCGDENGFFQLGNVFESDPIEIYNGEIFEHYRRMMKEGKIGSLEHCRDCTIPRSRALKSRSS